MELFKTLICCCIRQKREQYSYSDASEGLMEQGSDSPSAAAGDAAKKISKGKKKDNNSDDEVSQQSSLTSSVGVSALFMPLL